MKLIIGLGNPGKEYAKTRHNVGFVVVEKMAGETDWNKWGKSLVKKEDGVLFIEPQTFMNRSGEAAAEAINFYKLDLNDVYVVHDDLDLTFGEYKVQKGVGPKGHNGVLSVEEHLGTGDFWRVRVGVDSREGTVRTSGEEYVLESFSDTEKKILDGVIDKVIEEIKNAVRI